MARKLVIVALIALAGASAAANETDYSVLAIGIRAVEAGTDIEALVGDEDWSFNPYWEAVREVITARREGRAADVPEDWDVAVPEAAVLAALEEAGK